MTKQVCCRPHRSLEREILQGQLRSSVISCVLAAKEPLGFLMLLSSVDPSKPCALAFDVCLDLI